ncbi:hypothetical protein PG999_000429 [Apiospora kogelbergensis]|uniref:Hemerythrin-like domain-containing protein n=1 Tax=Apiospora kogelbergensis TaxID=1337665 RepID=A0AAW0RBV0_9PEZI
MALSHTAFIRVFNSIYQQAPRVPAPDKADFVGYFISWHDCVEAHHRYEEEAFIPNVDKAAGQTGFLHEAIEEYKGASSSPPELLSIMESFQDALHAHFVSEPAAIAALARHSTLGLVFNALPVFYLNMNHAEFEGGVWDGIFPSFKGTGRALLTRGIPMWHTQRWRFASCTPDGRLK